MESQITLVNPITTEEPALVLDFTPDSVKATTITQRSTGQALYQVGSNKNLSESTIWKVGAPGPPLMFWVRNEIFSDKISFNGNPPLKLRKWLQYDGIGCIKMPVHAEFEVDGRNFTWKSSFGTHELALYSGKAPSNPIAWGQRSQKRVKEGGGVVRSQAYLALEPEAIEKLDWVVISYVILEWGLRASMMRDDVHSDGWGAASGGTTSW